MKRIPLTQGKVALVDDEDYERIAAHKWNAYEDRDGLWYAKREVKGRSIRMHQEVMQQSQIDHRDGDGLNNQKTNLRAASSQQNSWNRAKICAPCHSKYKGVTLNSGRGKKWSALIKADGKYRRLGNYDHEEDAARAYNKAALLYFGEFAKLNVVPR